MEDYHYHRDMARACGDAAEQAADETAAPLLARIAELEGLYAETREALTAESTLAADALNREQDLLVRIAELEAENARLKAGSEWHYLPETPGTIRDVLGAFEGADALIQCYYFRLGKWYASEECADFSDADVHNKEMLKAPYAWRELPTMPPRP